MEGRRMASPLSGGGVPMNFPGPTATEELHLARRALEDAEESTPSPTPPLCLPSMMAPRRKHHIIPKPPTTPTLPMQPQGFHTLPHHSPEKGMWMDEERRYVQYTLRFVRDLDSEGLRQREDELQRQHGRAMHAARQDHKLSKARVQREHEELKVQQKESKSQHKAAQTALLAERSALEKDKEDLERRQEAMREDQKAWSSAKKASYEDRKTEVNEINVYREHVKKEKDAAVQDRLSVEAALERRQGDLDRQWARMEAAQRQLEREKHDWETRRKTMDQLDAERRLAEEKKLKQQKDDLEDAQERWRLKREEEEGLFKVFKDSWKGSLEKQRKRLEEENDKLRDAAERHTALAEREKADMKEELEAHRKELKITRERLQEEQQRVMDDADRRKREWNNEKAADRAHHEQGLGGEQRALQMKRAEVDAELEYMATRQKHMLDLLQQREDEVSEAEKRARQRDEERKNDIRVVEERAREREKDLDQKLRDIEDERVSGRRRLEDELRDLDRQRRELYDQRDAVRRERADIANALDGEKRAWEEEKLKQRAAAQEALLAERARQHELEMATHKALRDAEGKGLDVDALRDQLAAQKKQWEEHCAKQLRDQEGGRRRVLDEQRELNITKRDIARMQKDLEAARSKHDKDMIAFKREQHIFNQERRHWDAEKREWEDKLKQLQPEHRQLELEKERLRKERMDLLSQRQKVDADQDSWTREQHDARRVAQDRDAARTQDKDVLERMRKDYERRAKELEDVYKVKLRELEAQQNESHEAVVRWQKSQQRRQLARDAAVSHGRRRHEAELRTHQAVDSLQDAVYPCGQRVTAFSTRHLELIVSETLTPYSHIAFSDESHQALYPVCAVEDRTGRRKYLFISFDWYVVDLQLWAAVEYGTLPEDVGVALLPDVMLPHDNKVPLLALLFQTAKVVSRPLRLPLEVLITCKYNYWVTDEVHTVVGSPKFTLPSVLSSPIHTEIDDTGDDTYSTYMTLMQPFPLKRMFPVGVDLESEAVHHIRHDDTNVLTVTAGGGKLTYTVTLPMYTTRRDTRVLFSAPKPLSLPLQDTTAVTCATRGYHQGLAPFEIAFEDGSQPLKAVRVTISGIPTEHLDRPLALCRFDKKRSVWVRDRRNPRVLRNKQRGAVQFVLEKFCVHMLQSAPEDLVVDVDTLQPQPSADHRTQSKRWALAPSVPHSAVGYHSTQGHHSALLLGGDCQWEATGDTKLHLSPSYKYAAYTGGWGYIDGEDGTLWVWGVPLGGRDAHMAVLLFEAAVDVQSATQHPENRGLTDHQVVPFDDRFPNTHLVWRVPRVVITALLVRHVRVHDTVDGSGVWLDTHHSQGARMALNGPNRSGVPTPSTYSEG